MKCQDTQISNSLPIQLEDFENLRFQSRKLTEPHVFSLILNTHKIVWVIDNHQKMKKSLLGLYILIYPFNTLWVECLCVTAQREVFTRILKIGEKRWVVEIMTRDNTNPPATHETVSHFEDIWQWKREYLFSHFVSWWRWHLDVSDVYYRCIFFWKGWRKLFLSLDFVIYFLNDLFSHVLWKGLSMPAFLVFNTCVFKITLQII